MSLFRNSDYKQKDQRVVSKKTKLPTQDKTIKHNCSQCPRTDAKRYPITDKECRWLCPNCINKFHNGSKKENSVNFVKASRLLRR